VSDRSLDGEKTTEQNTVLGYRLREREREREGEKGGRKNNAAALEVNAKRYRFTVRPVRAVASPSGNWRENTSSVSIRRREEREREREKEERCINYNTAYQDPISERGFRFGQLRSRRLRFVLRARLGSAVSPFHAREIPKCTVNTNPTGESRLHEGK